MLSYSRLCETSADKVAAAKLEIPEGFKFLKLKLMEASKIIEKNKNFKNLKRSV